MSRFVDFFYPLPARRRTAGAVFLWWESRRIAYNLIVGGVGCATVVGVTLIGSLAPAMGPPPLVMLVAGAALYGVLANLCYFLGPLTELAMYHLWGDEAPRAGPALFRQGLLFSVGLTLFPIALIGLATAARLLSLLIR